VFHAGEASLGRVPEAITEYQNVLRLEPNHADAENNLGAMLAAQGRMDEAIVHFQKSLKINPNHTDARNNLRAALATRIPKQKAK